MSTESARADGDRGTDDADTVDELPEVVADEHVERVAAAAEMDRGRWDGEVVATAFETFTWGTHTFEAELHVFADGSGNVHPLDPPDGPPPAAAEIVADALAGRWALPELGIALARAWGLKRSELADTDGRDP